MERAKLPHQHGEMQQTELIQKQLNHVDHFKLWPKFSSSLAIPPESAFSGFSAIVRNVSSTFLLCWICQARLYPITSGH